MVRTAQKLVVIVLTSVTILTDVAMVVVRLVGREIGVSKVNLVHAYFVLNNEIVRTMFTLHVFLNNY